MLIILLCITVSGCATTKGKSSHIGGIVKDMHFKGLNDEQALVFFSQIYNEPVQTEVDQTAKDITVTAFISALRSRNSDVIKNSGLLERPYKEVELDKWTNEDLKTYYDELSYVYDKNFVDKRFGGEIKDLSGRVFYSTSDKEKKPKKEEEIQIREIIELTALHAVDAEQIRRGNKERTWKTATSLAMTGLSTAAQIAMNILSGFILFR